MKLLPNVYESGPFVVALLVCVYVVCVLGWVLNFQNLWQYWPATGGIMAVPVQWVISLIGVFVAPLGVFTGWVL